jgi:hypothetical protein
MKKAITCANLDSHASKSNQAQMIVPLGMTASLMIVTMPLLMK